MSELLHRVRVLDPVTSGDRLADVRIAEGEVAIAPQLEPRPEDRVREAEGWIFAPGLVDLYSHSGEPGREDCETVASLTAAATAGGVTRLHVLPDTVPPLDTPGAIAHLQGRLDLYPSVRGRCWGALTVGLAAAMVEAGELAAGVAGFTNGQPLADLALVRRLLEYIQPLEKVVAIAPVHVGLQGGGAIREGKFSARSGLLGDPSISETAGLAALLEIVAAIATPVHIMRVSTARSVELIADAKARGVPVTASTTWLHLLESARTVAATYDPHLRLDPPLGDDTDRAALAAAVKTGVIDAIAFDHAPFAYEEKAVAFGQAPPGAIALELALPLLWERFVASGEWSALELWQALSANPARCLGQEPPRCTEGPAEAILFDPAHVWTVTPASLASLSSNTFWLGKSVRGKVERVWNGAARAAIAASVR